MHRNVSPVTCSFLLHDSRGCVTKSMSYTASIPLAPRETTQPTSLKTTVFFKCQALASWFLFWANKHVISSWSWPGLSLRLSDKERSAVALTIWCLTVLVPWLIAVSCAGDSGGGGTYPGSFRCSADVLLSGWGDLKLSHALTPPVSPGDGCVVRDIEGERQSINRRLGDKCHADCSSGLFSNCAHTHLCTALSLSSANRCHPDLNLPTASWGKERRI